MVIITKRGAESSRVENLKQLLEENHITPHVSEGSLQTLIGCIGDVAHLDPGMIEALDVAVTATAIGADGLFVELHDDYAHAKCDGAQSQMPEMMEKIGKIRSALI